MTVLALETSCDETAIAILRGDGSGHELLASEVASQVAAHEKYGGIVPEIASRNHLIYAPRLLDRAASAAKTQLSEIDAFAATSGPGLASSLMIGASIAKGLAIGFGKRYLGINHLEGHLLSPFFGVEKDGDNDIKPNVSLIADTRCWLSLVAWRIINLSAIPLTMPRARHSTKWPKCSD
jgi:N6-L-threonylcarbamoyladenine synthase